MSMDTFMGIFWVSILIGVPVATTIACVLWYCVICPLAQKMFKKERWLYEDADYMDALKELDEYLKEV